MSYQLPIHADQVTKIIEMAQFVEENRAGEKDVQIMYEQSRRQLLRQGNPARVCLSLPAA